jgi:hypothetical protein
MLHGGVLLSGAVGPVLAITERVHRLSLVYTPIEATSGESFYIQGDHRVTVPALYHAALAGARGA